MTKVTTFLGKNKLLLLGATCSPDIRIATTGRREQGKNTTWSVNPFENGGSMFLQEDLKIINSKIPQLSPLFDLITGRRFNSPKDNFTERIKPKA